MSNLTDILRRSDVFKSLDDPDIERLSLLFDSRELHTGDVLTSEGDPAQYFFLLEKGTLLLAYEDEKAVVLKDCGDFAGMELLSAKGICKATATVLEPGRAHAVSREEFLAFIQEDTPGAASAMASWQEVLDGIGDFVKNREKDNVPISF
ncbi:cyclic nucleotide-binding domain-containing protein [Desulfospira joergensenii]|uniref:cyclic nucleotide-binding domain-containing protein n=1 Tax=Desulfospira joergensenii TaxID=53329 RepID=UPI0003B60E03|nr:cyclic nucleotide-binding domain-containing protein [Desulfospira joergensenii]